MQVATAIGAAELPLKRSNQLLNQLWVTMKNTMRWRLTTGALNSFIGGLQQAFGYSKSLNASLNDIRIVTGKSADEMSRFAKEANQAAKELSTTTTTYTDASLIYYQQGLDSEAVKERTDATIKMANVTGQSAETISSQMTAVWNNFREGSRTLESYADTMVALGATTASSSKEIAEGLEKFAPIANSVGLSFDYASAALATLVATTRESASVAGNALKTLFSRLEGLKLGETLEDGTDLNKYSQALYTVGINIKDTNGELKDMDLILSELGNRWKDLARDEQMALAQTVGGVRQYAQLVALMDNWQTFQQNLVTARTAEGSLEKQAQIYAESWEASRDRVKAAAEDVYDSLINPKVFIDLDKMSQAVLKPLASILDGIGGLTGLLPIAAALMTKVYSAQIANVMRDMAVNIGLMTGREQERARAIQAQSTSLVERLDLTYQEESLDAKRAAILKEQISLQGEINAKYDQYSESQKAWIENGLYSVNLLKQQAQDAIDTLGRATDNFEEIKNNLGEGFKVSESFTDKLVNKEELAKITAQMKSFSQETQQALQHLKSDALFGKNDNVFNSITEAIEQVAEKSIKLDSLKGMFDATDQSTVAWSTSVETLARELGILSEGETLANGGLEKIKDKLFEAGGVVDTTKQEFEDLILLFKEMGNPEFATAIDKYVYYLNAMEKQGIKATLSFKQFVAGLNEVKNPPPAMTDWADTLVAVANGASRAAMAIRSFENIIEVFSDDSLSTIEKFTRILTSLSMLLPTLTAVIGVFGKGALKAGADAATAGVTAGTGIAAGATAAKAAMPIVTAIIVGIYAVIKVIDALVTTQKEARESIQKTIDAYKEVESELQSLQDELSTTQDRIKELQELAESGSISIVEQEELQNLQVENDRLERQIKLREKLAEQKLKDAVREIQQRGKIAYRFTTEEPFNSNSPIDFEVPTSLTYAGDIEANLWQFNEFGERYLQTRDSVIQQFEDESWFQQDRDQYIKYIDELYAAIDEAREEHHEKWKSENFETYEQLESDYLTYLEAYKKGYITERDLTDQLIRLQTARKKMYDNEGEYAESFIDPVLAQLSNQDLNTLYNTIGPVYRTYLSESGQDLLDLYGVSPYELQEQVLAVRDKAFSELAKFGFEDLTDKLGYVELKLIADNSFKSFEELLNYLQANSGIIPVSLQVQAIEDARTEALAALASGELLSDELITKIQEVYQGIADVTDFANLSVKDQIEFLTTQGKIARQQLDDLLDKETNLQRRLDIVNNQIKNPQRYDISKETLSEKIYLDVELSNVQSEIEKLKEQVEKEPWQVNIELGDEAAATINNLKRSIDLINDDLTVSAENLVELGKRYPEALVGAHYDANQNILQLEEEKYNQLKNLLDEAIDGTVEKNRDASAQVLTDQATIASGILAIIDETEDGKREEYRKTLIQTFDNNQKQFEDTKKMALSSMIEVVKNEIATRQARLESMIEGQASSKTVTDTLAKNAEITTQNYNNAAQNILNAFDIAFRQIALGAKSVAEALAGGRDYTTIAKNVSTQGYSAERGVTLDTVYAENKASVESSHEYQQLTREIDKLNQFVGRIEDYEAGNISWDKVKEFFDRDLPESVQRGFSDAFVKAVGIGFDSSEEAVDALGALFADPEARSTIQEILNETLSTLQHLLESPEEDKTKGSGGKPDYAKLDNADLEKHEDLLEEIEDRYHEITREIERQNRILDQLETQAERTYGLDRLKLYEKELEELNGLYERQRAKQGRAERYLADVDKPRLQTAFQAIETKEGAADILGRYGFSGFSNIAVDLGKPGQEIKDYEALEDNIRQDTENFLVSYRAFMVEYDNFLQEYNALTDEDKANQQERALQLQQEYELVTAQFETVKTQQEERLAAIKQYEETLDTINTLAHEMEETLRREEDTKLKEVTHRMDVILDVRDARKQIRDFTKEIAESFGDALTHGVRTAELGWDQAKDEMAMYKEYVQEYNDLKSLLDNATEYTDTEAIVAELRELEGNIIESGQRLLEWSEQVENMFVEALSAAADRFSYFTNQLEHNDAILSTMKELYALQGQTYKTQQGFNRLQRVAQERLETQVGQARLQRKWFEEADSRLQEAQAQLDALIAEKGAEAEQDFRYDTFKKNRDALLKEQQEAQKAMLSAAQQAMETAQQMYLDQIEKAVYEFGQALSGGIGLDLLQDKYDHYIEEEERYLDKVNEAYQVAAWYDKLQKDIDNTTNKLTKDRLKALQQEIDIRREGNTLSQYDLDILEAKYKVLQAQADLEDAQNAKSQLRLVRDSQGNWNYQFTTNPDDIAAKEQELLQAENEWYNIAKEQTKEVTGEIIATWQECQEAINEIYSDTSNFVMNEETGRLELTKEAQERETEIRRFYAEKVKFLEEEKQIAIGDMTEAGNQAMIHMAIAAGETVEDITGITGREVESLVETTGMNSQQLLQLSLSQIEDILENRLAQLAEDIGISADDLKDMLQRKENGIESDADSTFKAILESADPATVDLYNLFAENWGLIGSLVGETSSGIKGNIADTYTKIQSGLNDTGTAMNLFDNIFAKDLTSMTKNTAIFEVEFDRAVENMQNSFDNYGETIADVADDCGVSLEALDDSVNMVSDSTDRMIWEGLDAAQALWDQVDATWDAQQGYLDLASAVWEYIYALQALAAEQVVPTIEEASGVNTFDNSDWLDYEGDLSQKMAAALYNNDMESYNKFKQEREGAVNRAFNAGYDVVDNNRIEIALNDADRDLLKKFATGDQVIVKNEVTYTSDEWKKIHEATGTTTIGTFATGGYTGDFDNGRLAILHEKELVLNAEDTQNILAAVSMVRSMDDIFGSLAEQLDNDGLAAMALLGSRVGGIGAPAPASTDFEQHVTIESVSFPGVTSSREIEEAFESLVNDAAQWARRRKS